MAIDIDALIQSVQQAGEDFAAFVESLPVEAFARRPGDDEWSVAELTGHVSEFPRTFAAEAARLAANPGAVVGRNLDDEGRLGALRRLEGRGPAEAAALVREAIAGAVATLRDVPDDAWDVRGTRLANGEPITARGIAEMILVAHLREHLAQARAAAEVSGSG
jgi:hypothetical protein